jgi:cell division initiation protein
MLTPQEVSERSFQKASFGGYHMAQVDEFLDVLTGDYTALYNENAVLKSKMKVLVDKVEEYRSTEEAMRKALMTAQRMADELVRESEEKKEAILQEAEQEAQRRREEVERELTAETYRLHEAQRATAAFVEKVRALQAGQEQFLTRLQDLYPADLASPQEDAAQAAADEIDDNVQRLLAQAMMDATAENLRAKETDPTPEDLDDTAEFDPIPDAKTKTQDREDEEDHERLNSRIDFGSLQFGRDYEIT